MSSSDFDQFSSAYEELLDRSVRVSGEGSEYFAEYKASYIVRLTGQDFQGKILDYGCGIGLLSSALKRQLPKSVIHGYDVSAESLKMIKADLTSQGLFSDDISCLDCDYDLTIVANVMHHLPLTERQEAISEIARRLAQCGQLVLFEHNPLNPLTRWVVKHCPFDHDAVLLRPAEARCYLQKAKMAILRRDYLVFFPRILSPLRPLEPLLAWLPAGGQYALVGAKV